MVRLSMKYIDAGLCINDSCEIDPRRVFKVLTNEKWLPSVILNADPAV